MKSSLLKICVQCEYTILRGSDSEPDRSVDYTFTETHSSGQIAEITVSYPKSRILVTMANLDWPAEVVSELRGLNRCQGADLSGAALAVVEPLLKEIRNSVRDLLALLKYHLRHFKLRESLFSINFEKWTDEDGDTHDFPGTCGGIFQADAFYPLDDQSRLAVQAALTEGALPLLAMRHLHRAKAELQPHHKWIDATIAAELAVKEVLCKACPKIRHLLLEMPSPPLSKMYGALLEEYLGEESPYRKELIKGQEKRNNLVHLPLEVQVDEQKAIDYVNTVESAIFHLLHLLYPHDELIERAWLTTKKASSIANRAN